MALMYWNYLIKHFSMVDLELFSCFQKSRNYSSEDYLDRQGKLSWVTIKKSSCILHHLCLWSLWAILYIFDPSNTLGGSALLLYHCQLKLLIRMLIYTMSVQRGFFFFLFADCCDTGRGHTLGSQKFWSQNCFHLSLEKQVKTKHWRSSFLVMVYRKNLEIGCDLCLLDATCWVGRDTTWILCSLSNR